MGVVSLLSVGCGGVAAGDGSGVDFESAERPSWMTLNVVESLSIKKGFIGEGNQLEIISFSKTPEELIALANEAFLNGQRLYDTRDVKHENLYASILKLKEMANYLNTIDPKPDFFTEGSAMLRVAEDTLVERYNDRVFRGKQAQATQQWRAAYEHFRVIMEMLPEHDPRYKEAVSAVQVIEARMEE